MCKPRSSLLLFLVGFLTIVVILLLMQQNYQGILHQLLSPAPMSPVNILRPTSDPHILLYPFPRASMKVYRLQEHNQTVTSEEILIATYTNDDFISYYLHHPHIGEWERTLVFWLCTYLQRHPNIPFLDVGSNMGVFTLAVAAMRHSKHHVVAVDANVNNCRRLMHSLLVNGLQDRVTVINNALDSRRDTVNLILDSSNIGASEIGAETPNSQKEVLHVQSILFDDLIPHIPGSSAVMKIDIEMSEHRALEKAHRLFALVRMQFVMMEWHYGRPNVKVGRDFIIDFFTSRGYTPHLIFVDWKNISSTNHLIPLSVAKNASWPENIVWIANDFVYD